MFKLVLLTMYMAVLPPVTVRPSVGHEPLDIWVQVRSAPESRSLYVAISDGDTVISSSARDTHTNQSLYTFTFKRLLACECEIVAYSVEPNEVRLIGSRPLIVTGLPLGE